MALLAIDGFQTNDEGNITLTQEQLKSIDDRLKDLEEKEKTNSQAVKDKDDTIKNLEAQLDQAQKESKEKDEQIQNLKGSAGATTTENPANEENSFTAQDMYNSIKDV